MTDFQIMLGGLSLVLFGGAFTLLLWGDWKKAKAFKAILIVVVAISAVGAFYAIYSQIKLTEQTTEKYVLVSFENQYSTVNETDVIGLDGDSYTILPTGNKLLKKTLYGNLEWRDTSVVQQIDSAGNSEPIRIVTLKAKTLRIGSAEATRPNQSGAEIKVKCRYNIGDTVKVRGDRIVP